MAVSWGARAVVELASGSAAARDVRVGDRLLLTVAPATEGARVSSPLLST
jgi:hypothetical protein